MPAEKALRRLLDIEGADVTWWDRLFQVRAAATGKARSPTVDSHVRRTFSVSKEEERRRLRVPKSAVNSFVGEIRRYCPVPTLVHENSKLELNSLRCSQPMLLVEERSDVVIPRRREHESRRRVHDWLVLLQKVGYDGMPARVALL